jgi:hypothetical protein
MDVDIGVRRNLSPISPSFPRAHPVRRVNPLFISGVKQNQLGKQDWALSQSLD